jgi:hypothetical protein
MARIFSKNGEVTITPTEKRTYQGSSKNTKYSQRGSRPRRKQYRGQGRG